MNIFQQISFIHKKIIFTFADKCIICIHSGVLTVEKINLSHVQFIGTSAFSECSNLDAGNLSAKIDRNAFEGTAVRNLDIKDISKLDNGVYQNCENLESVTINGDRAIPNGLFSGCKNLKNVTIDEGITAVGDSAFFKTAVEKIILPSTGNCSQI